MDVMSLFLMSWLDPARIQDWSPRPLGDAPDVLRQRYARGEINREEFEAKRKDLQR